MNKLAIFKVTVYDFGNLHESIDSEDVRDLKGDNIYEHRSRIADGDYIPGDSGSAIRLISNILHTVEEFKVDSKPTICRYIRPFRKGSYFEFRIEREDSTVIDSVKIDCDEDEITHFHEIVDFVNRNLCYV